MNVDRRIDQGKRRRREPRLTEMDRTALSPLMFLDRDVLSVGGHRALVPGETNFVASRDATSSKFRLCLSFVELSGMPADAEGRRKIERRNEGLRGICHRIGVDLPVL